MRYDFLCVCLSTAKRAQCSGVSSFLLIITLLGTITQLASGQVFHDHGLKSWEEADAAAHPGLDTLLDSALEGGSYAPDFIGLNRDIIGRAPEPLPTGIVSNAKVELDIKPGDKDYYSFAVATSTNAPRAAAATHRSQLVKDGLGDNGDVTSPASGLNLTETESLQGFLTKRQDANGETVWISINTCLQPSFNSSQDQANPPQLSIHVSTSARNPGPDTRNTETFDLVEGFASTRIVATKDVFISVSAPNATTHSGDNLWNYNLAASTDGPYHSYVDDSGVGLYLIDSDPHAALLVTSNLTGWVDYTSPGTEDVDDYLTPGPPFGLFVSNVNDTQFVGLSRSYCALQGSQMYALNDSTSTVGAEMGITYSQPPNGHPEQQIYMPGLNKTSRYYGHLSQINATHRYGDSVVGGGGTIYPQMNFTTKRDENCAVIYNLSFCSDVAYAVPANPYNPKVSSVQDLAAVYDSFSAALWKNFTYSLMMTPCNTTPSAQYSLVAGCDNCTTAYKTWLCAVTIPRCEDFLVSPSDNLTQDNGFDQSFLMPRNVAQQPLPGSVVPPIVNSTQLDWVATNSSRNNDTIAGLIQPGPYMEVLPCEDLCYDLTRMCPASLQFACPKPGSMLMAASYGKRGIAKGGSGTCSAPGVLYFQSSAALVTAALMPVWICLLLSLTLHIT
ncbi:MAG: stretch-activated cation channel mid1 [Chrysothrix sp. TS-e1954]|nr:MAG: stretch-activated cation channel mid1 [Chrysothrix sp. TS-e1954]